VEQELIILLEFNPSFSEVSDAQSLVSVDCLKIFTQSDIIVNFYDINHNIFAIEQVCVRLKHIYIQWFY
jgi:hypothetical protein